MLTRKVFILLLKFDFIMGQGYKIFLDPGSRYLSYATASYFFWKLE